MRKLTHIFQSQKGAQLLLNALHIVDQGMVSKLVCQNSQRHAFIVRGGSSHAALGFAEGRSSSKRHRSSFYGIGNSSVVPGLEQSPHAALLRANNYLCMADMFCTCQSFIFDVLSQRGHQQHGRQGDPVISTHSTNCASGSAHQPSIKRYGEDSLVYCKHLLAVKLARALGTFTVQRIPDDEFGMVLESVNWG